MEGTNEYFEDFVLESHDHIENIELNLLKLEMDKENLLIINDIYRSMHSVKGLAGFVGEYFIEDIAHQTENILSDLRSGERIVTRVVIDKILKSTDYIKKIVEKRELVESEFFSKEVTGHLDSLNTLFDDYKIGSILKDSAGLTQKKIEELMEKQKTEYKDKKLGEIAIHEKLIAPIEVVQALREQEDRKQVKISENDNYLRIPIKKLDEIIELLENLRIENSKIVKNSNENNLENRIKEIQKCTMVLRVTSLKKLFNKLYGVVRRTSQELNKSVEITFYGEENKIDKYIADKLLEPLAHIVRNSISHGIEFGDERRIQEKSEKGKIVVTVSSEMGEIDIKVKDDGAGLNLKKIKKRAKESGLLDESKNYSENEIFQMIFLPGFSTVDEINKISGRGVGLDIVKTVVESMNGKVNVSSLEGKCTEFRIKIPIKLSFL